MPGWNVAGVLGDTFIGSVVMRSMIVAVPVS